jgi:uncharacterized caspase-like protein
MKRLMIVLSLLSFLVSSLNAQNNISGVSKSGYVNISKDPPKPPYIELVKGSLQFIDDDGNNMIDADGSAIIQFQLHNSGSGAGLNLVINTYEGNKVNGLIIPASIKIGNLDVGKTQTYEIPISASMNLPNSIASLTIEVDELNGFDSDPFSIEIETRAFRAPKIRVVDYKVSSNSGNTLQKRRPFDLQILIQNIGEGPAQDVTVEIPVPDDIYCLSANENQNIGTLDVGEQYLIDYSFVTTNDYNTNNIPFKINLTESKQRFGDKEIVTLQMNQGVSNTKLVVEGNTESKTEIILGSLTSQVDKNIPTNPKVANRIALVIGNEDYSQNLNSEVNVEFARNDAEIFKQYALRTFGVEEKNMHFLLNATAGQMKRKIDLVTELARRLGNRCEVIVFYAGHGHPDELTKVPYLIPVDVDATNLGSAIKLSELYNKLGNTGASKVTIFLDACFSGGGRNLGLLAARSVALKPKKEAITGNMVVFSATTDAQIALPYKAKQHGMFTYYLLKALQDSKGEITYITMADELHGNVGIESLRINGKPQDPTVSVSPLISNKWKTWNFK